MEEQHRLVRGLGERAGQHELAARLGSPGMLEMQTAELGPALQVIVGKFVDEQVVRHERTLRYAKRQRVAPYGSAVATPYASDGRIS